MANCEKCGATLGAGSTVCAVCGSQVGQTTATEWTPVNAGSAGAATGTPATQWSSASPPAQGYGPVGQGTAFPQPPATPKKSALPKILAAGLVLLLVLVVAGVAGVAYVVHRVRQKAHELEAEYARSQSHSPRNNAPSRNRSSSTSGAAHAGSNGPGTPAAQKPDTKPAPVVAEAATGDRAHDWALQYERTMNSSEADLVVRAGSINNLGFGWPDGFDPFSGESTPMHPYPWKPPNNVAAGTDRILFGTSVSSGDTKHGGDGYSNILYECRSHLLKDADCQARRESMPRPIILPMGALPKVDAVMVQIFVDDFQSPVFRSHFQVSLDGTRIPSFEQAVNALDQTGPIGKLITLGLLPEYWPLLQSGEAKLLIDDPTTQMQDGYAVDFVRVLVNPHTLKYKVSLAVHVVDADKHTPIPGATVSAALVSTSTDKRGQCMLQGLPAGLVIASASYPGYDANSVQTDLPAGRSGTAEIPLHRHQEDTASLEKSIDQTGTATLYGIHFDTGSSKLRPDSEPALEAILGVMQKRTASNWVIAGHTDNQGTDAKNIPLSQARAAAVIAWLAAHGVDQGHLQPQGFGANRPVADNTTANGRALNRRVEVSSVQQ